MGSSDQRNVPSLTPELWAKVFSHVEERPESISMISLDCEQRQNQMEVHKLKLVCKQFREVYTSHPRLVQRVFLRRLFSVSSLPSLLAWLQQNKNSIQMVRTTGSPLVDALLEGLVSSEQSLKIIDVCEISACSLSLISAFKTLEQCALEHAATERLDLAPLGVLPRLNHVVLIGCFQGLRHLAGLTRSDCTNAEISDVQKFAPTLHHLEVKNSELEGIHTQGFSGCTALTNLVLRIASLIDSNEHEYMDGDLSLVPTSIGLLTKLHTLQLAGRSRSTRDLADLEWISKLTSLQDLKVSFGSSCGVVLPHATMLGKVTRLEIEGLRAGLHLDLDNEWHGLQALQKLSICGFRLNPGRNVAGLLQLQHLSEISFAGSTIPIDQGKQNIFAAFIYNLARLRPQVNVLSDGGDLLSYFM